MGKEEAIILIFSSVATIIILISGFVMILSLHYKKQKKQQQEKIELLHAHQKQLLFSQLETQTQTMHHFGREIHDSVGQKLTLASIYIKQLQGNKEKIETISHIVDESLKELRQLSKSLTDPEQINAGILSLLKEEMEKINRTGICFAEVKSNADIKLPQSAKHIVFRMLQEFIQNSLKHSSCKTILISFTVNENQLFISASDDGKGFNTDEKSNGIGLYSMKRRADELLASFQLKSIPGTGTTLNIQFPYQNITK